MQTRTYADLLELIQAMFGSVFATVELARIRALVNSRATMAYRATEYWPRFLKVGEERAVTSSVIPYEEATISTIDTFLRIHKTAPYYNASSQTFDFYVDGNGAHIIEGGTASTSAFVTYKATNDAVYGSSGSDTTDVPKEWFDYLAYGAYADALKMDGQTEKAAIADMQARDVLDTELIRACEQMPSFLTTMISTNANQQNRSW